MTRAHLRIACLALVVLTNLAILGGVAYNRSTQSAVFELTERELDLVEPWSGSENSGLQLRLDWLTAPGADEEAYDLGYLRSPLWLDARKLSELGFRVPPDDWQRGAARYERHQREVFLALEMDGPVYRDVQRHWETLLDERRKSRAAQPTEAGLHDKVIRNLQRRRTGGSRLMVVDAHLDRETLRRQYPDPDHHAIVRGVVSAMFTQDGIGGPPGIHASISRLSLGKVNVPLALRPVFQPLLGTSHEQGLDTPRYRVTLAWGKRLEPWIVDAALIE